jgi:hypothetical protein
MNFGWPVSGTGFDYEVRLLTDTPKLSVRVPPYFKMKYRNLKSKTLEHCYLLACRKAHGIISLGIFPLLLASCTQNLTYPN